MITINDDDDDVGSSKPSRGPLDESNNSWDESMLTAAFDRQIKLVQKSLEPPPPVQPPASAPKSSRSSLKTKTKETKTSKSEVKPDKDSKNVVTHSSRKFRFEEEVPEPESVLVDTNKPSVSGSSEGAMKEPTSTRSDRSTGQSNLNPIGGCLMPPPFDTSKLPNIEGEDEARASMLMSWYMAGYHTGYFEATRKLKKSGQKPE